MFGSGRSLSLTIASLVCLITCGSAVAQSVAKPASAPETAPMAQSGGAEACSRKNALGTSRVLEVGTTGGLEVGFKTYRHSLLLDDKEVVLTFDDGPVPGSTEQVLDALKAECVKATFFLIGRNAQDHPNLVRREIAEGHTIGSHSWSHPEKTLRGLSEAAAQAEIVDGISAVQTAAGMEAYVAGKPRVSFFRFPGFADTVATRALLRDRNIGVFGADLWASDWTSITPSAELRLILQRLDHERRGIILFHDTRPQTAAMLPSFLAELKRKGYRVVHMVPGSGTPGTLRDALPAWSSETEAILKQVMPGLLRPKASTPKVKHEM
ncbi:MAG: polysaccharide deacetylase [Hyphomicrobiales bacterium]|nr:polysaccharide deacetylase [Hyphomicrobiales bacterium]